MADVRSEPETPRRGVYDDLRPLLFSIAYGIVSSVSEAEDIVQEAFLRFHRAQSEGADIDSPRAWLSTVTTRLAINQVRSARARRETYVGTWLPEPLLTDPAPDASQHAETADSLSMRATPRDSSACSRPTSSSTPTVAARPERSFVRCTGANGSRGSFSSSERGWSSWAPRGCAWPKSTDSRERCIWATMGGPSWSFPSTSPRDSSRPSAMSRSEE